MSKPVAIAIRADHPEAGSRGPFAGYSNIRISVPSGGYGMAAPVAMPEPEARAVINLLGAAPDMLAALRALVAECRAHLDYEDDEDMEAACDAAADAIAKAEGKL